MNSDVAKYRALAGGALGIGAIFLGVFWFVSSPPKPGEKVTAGQMSALATRLDLLEQENRDLTAALSRRQEIGSQQAGNPATAQMQRNRQEHERRMLEDPAYAEQQERQRLTAMEREFNNEPIAPQWASKASIKAEDALVSAVASAGMQHIDGKVDCRSTQCRIQINVGDEGYNDLITYLSIGMSDMLPKSRIVTIPRSDGTYDVSIFAAASNSESADG